MSVLDFGTSEGAENWKLGPGSTFHFIFKVTMADCKIQTRAECVAYVCDLRPSELEVGKPGVQSKPLLHSMHEAGLVTWLNKEAKNQKCKIDHIFLYFPPFCFVFSFFEVASHVT